jgi:hypothetical protein
MNSRLPRACRAGPALVSRSLAIRSAGCRPRANFGHIRHAFAVLPRATPARLTKIADASPLVWWVICSLFEG